MASTPPAGRFFGHSARSVSAWARRRSSPAWSRRRPTIRRPPTSRPRAAAPGSCSDSMVENGFVTPERGGSGRLRRRSRSSRRPKQNSVRYFTDWALPQLDTLIDESSEPIDVWTTLDPGHAGAPPTARSTANTPARRAGRAGRARPRRRGAGDGRRPRLCRFDLQPRDPGRAPAGIGLQAVRLSRRARIRDEADRHDRRRAGHDRRLDAAQLDPHLCRARSRCAKPSPVRSTRSAPRSARSSASAPSPTWPAASESRARSRPIRRWCWARATSG